MTVLLTFQIPDVFYLDKVHGIQAADHDADDHAGHDLQGRMADHLLQMHILQKRRVLFADVDPLFDHLVEHFGLLARLVAHTHCIVHGDDGDHTGHSKNSRTDSLAAMTIAQTVALWALGIPPSPHILSSWNLPSRIKLMMVLSTCATNQPTMETVNISLTENNSLINCIVCSPS